MSCIFFLFLLLISLFSRSIAKAWYFMIVEKAYFLLSNTQGVSKLIAFVEEYKSNVLTSKCPILKLSHLKFLFYSCTFYN